MEIFQENSFDMLHVYRKTTDFINKLRDVTKSTLKDINESPHLMFLQI